MQWHAFNQSREFYFMAPHVAIYVGILGVMAACAVLYARGEKISLWVFILFPLLSVFDEFWHRLYGIELSTSAMMFWSPAHWSFGVVSWFVLYALYRTGIEKEYYISLYVRTLLYYVLPIRLIMYVLIPLAPFYIYTHLHTAFSILVPVAVSLLLCTMYKIVQQKDVLLPGLLLVTSSFVGPFQFFFAQHDMVYNITASYRILTVAVFLFCIAGMLTRTVYMVLAFGSVVLIALIAYLQGHGISYMYVLFSLSCSVLFASFYYDIEKRLVPLARRFFLHTIDPYEAREKT
jgi:hypothetical protein